MVQVQAQTAHCIEVRCSCAEAVDARQPINQIIGYSILDTYFKLLNQKI